MGQPEIRKDGPQLFHINFHTIHNRAVFEVPEYYHLVQAALLQILDTWHIDSLAWTVMPTHIHLIVLAYPDLPLGRIMRLVKGGLAHAVLLEAPELREDLGDHLWQEGYDWVEITSHQQCINTICYVQENRRHGGLEE